MHDNVSQNSLTYAVYVALISSRYVL